MPTFYSDLIDATDESRRAFETSPALLAVIADGMSIDRYGRFLLELYHVVYQFNPITAAAASRVGDEHREVRYYLYRHMAEELGHELMVLRDLVAVEVPEGRALAHVPAANTLAMTGYNFWRADRGHPCSVLGMLYCLEVIASVHGGPFVESMKSAIGLEDGLAFLSSHSSLDADHLVDLRNVLDTVIDAPAQQAIIESVRVNFAGMRQLIEGV